MEIALPDNELKNEGMKGLMDKIRRKWMKIRLRPIRVFVVHNVSEQYSSAEGLPEDWMSTADFRRSILELKKKYTFISTEEALRHLKNDVIRFRNYAVLHADDGYKSVYKQLPWLIENNVPITMLINTKYLDGQSCSDHVWEYVHEQHPELKKEEFIKERYMTFDDLKAITSPIITIGSHGHEHIDNGVMDMDTFIENLDVAINIISKYHACAPYHAYPCGRYTKEEDRILVKRGIVPLLADFGYNWNDATRLHREVLPKI